MKTFKELIMESLDDMLETAKPNELGKLSAPAAEIYARDWINEDTSIKCYKRPDNGKENNQGGYDLVTHNGLRIQVKVRSRTLYLENTRRHTAKNEGPASKSGHVAYSEDEFDVVVFVRPGSFSEKVPNDWKDTSKWELLAIPAERLKDNNNPGFIVRHVPARIKKEFQGKAVEVLEKLEKQRIRSAA